MGQSADEVRRAGQAGDIDDRTSTTGFSPVERVAPADDATGTPDTAAIEADIEQTRAEMSETIDAIQQRLSPDALAEQAKETVREATIGRVETMARNVSDTAYETREGLLETIRQNPVPAAMTGIGLAWLWMNRRAAPRRPVAQYDGGEGYYPELGYDGGARFRSYPENRDRYGYATGASTRSGRGTIDRARETAGNLVNQAGETAGQMANQTGESAGQMANQVSQTASNLVGQAQETAGSLADQAQYQARRVEDGFERSMRENPLAVGAVALALGTALGLALPRTERENELLGEARDTLVDKAQSLAQDTFEKVQHVAEEAQHTAQREAQNQGLTQ